MAVLQLLNKTRTALNNNAYALGVFLDLSKAFDAVNNTILLKKLLHYYFTGITYKVVQELYSQSTTVSLY